jgi:hypothetical protein
LIFFVNLSDWRVQLNNIFILSKVILLLNKLNHPLIITRHLLLNLCPQKNTSLSREVMGDTLSKFMVKGISPRVMCSLCCLKLLNVIQHPISVTSLFNRSFVLSRQD